MIPCLGQPFSLETESVRGYSLNSKSHHPWFPPALSCSKHDISMVLNIGQLLQLAEPMRAACSHVTFSGFTANGSMQKSSPHLEFLTGFVAAAVYIFFRYHCVSRRCLESGQLGRLPFICVTAVGGHGSVYPASQASEKLSVMANSA